MLYETIPHQIEAEQIQMTAGHIPTPVHLFKNRLSDRAIGWVMTAEGPKNVFDQDWVLHTGTPDLFRRCPADVFKRNYRPAQEVDGLI